MNQRFLIHTGTLMAAIGVCLYVAQNCGVDEGNEVNLRGDPQGASETPEKATPGNAIQNAGDVTDEDRVSLELAESQKECEHYTYFAIGDKYQKACYELSEGRAIFEGDLSLKTFQDAEAMRQAV